MYKDTVCHCTAIPIGGPDKPPLDMDPLNRRQPLWHMTHGATHVLLPRHMLIVLEELSPSCTATYYLEVRS